ncbi:TetR/AcrR family transcriptional regulator [Tropicimonas sp. IMCC34011]|uniref:TetR/AcrR family transcriptional regulator n=1 Tax=Tropicimonas sp. IMCC34011 TaxID=2248759 RepID=UPI0018E59B26|nr:TetR/AcrR family transcriptional regulator [Tropicimonas sp. IMCC34011]
MTEDDSIRRKRGRPVVLSAEDRRDIVLGAVGEVFETSGMDGLTMTAVAARAGMSKRTLYDLFRNQDELISAYLDRLRNVFLRPLSPGDTELPLEERLRRMLEPRPEFPLSGLPLEVLRAGIANAGSESLLARICSERGPEAVRRMIRAELDRAVARGEIPRMDTHAAASLLKDMVQVSAVEMLLDRSRLPDLAQLRARFDLGLRIFLAGIKDEGSAGV